MSQAVCMEDVTPCEQSPVKEESLTLFSPIGEGADSVVYSGLLKGEKCAVKFLPAQSKLTNSHYEASKRNMYAESKVLAGLAHPNVISQIKPAAKGSLVGPYGVPIEADFSVLEVLEGGELFSFAATKPLSEDELRFYAIQIVSALLHIHSQGFAHRDIKPENILLSGDLRTAKIIDFGYAVHSAEFSKAPVRGTAEYLPPELHCMVPCDLQKADVFSLGVTLYALATGRFPCIRSCTQCDPLYRLICEKKYAEFWRKSGCKIPLSEEFKVMVQDMLNPSGFRRPTMDKVKDYRWFLIQGKSQAEIVKVMGERKSTSVIVS